MRACIKESVALDEEGKDGAPGSMDPPDEAEAAPTARAAPFVPVMVLSVEQLEQYWQKASASAAADGKPNQPVVVPGMTHTSTTLPTKPWSVVAKPEKFMPQPAARPLLPLKELKHQRRSSEAERSRPSTRTHRVWSTLWIVGRMRFTFCLMCSCHFLITANPTTSQYALSWANFANTGSTASVASTRGQR